MTGVEAHWTREVTAQWLWDRFQVTNPDLVDPEALLVAFNAGPTIEGCPCGHPEQRHYLREVDGVPTRLSCSHVECECSRFGDAS